MCISTLATQTSPLNAGSESWHRSSELACERVAGEGRDAEAAVALLLQRDARHGTCAPVGISPAWVFRWSDAESGD